MDLLHTLGLKKKKSRSERLKENVSDVVHSVADTLDDLVAESRKEAPKVAKKASKAVEEARKEAPKVAKKAEKKLKKAKKEAAHLKEEVGGRASSLASELNERTDAPRAEAGEKLGQAADAAGAKSAAILAALGALTADWDDVARTLTDELGKSREAAGKKAGDAKEALKEKAPKRSKKKEKGYPGFFVWLLRLGVGIWFVQRLRGRDIAAYIDHGSGERLRAAKEHPVQGYRDVVNGYLLPNASLVGIATVAAEALTALGYITGINRRMAALAGLAVTSNDFMLDYKDEEKKGQDLALLLAQLLLLRTGG